MSRVMIEVNGKIVEVSVESGVYGMSVEIVINVNVA